MGEKAELIEYFYNGGFWDSLRTTIYESDSNSKLKDYISKIYESRNKEYYTLCSVGENCIQHIEGSSTEVSSEFIFSIKNRYVSIWAGNAGRGQVITKEKLQTETLKVAEAIKSKID